MPIKKVEYKQEFVMLETSGLQIKSINFIVKTNFMKLFPCFLTEVLHMHVLYYFLCKTGI